MSRIHEALKTSRTGTGGIAGKPHGFSARDGSARHPSRTRVRGVAHGAPAVSARRDGRLPESARQCLLSRTLHLRHLAGALRSGGVEAGRRDHALLQPGRECGGYRTVPHAAFTALPDARENVAEENSGDQCAAAGRQVIRGGQPGAGAGSAAWPARAADRRRPARGAAALRPGYHLFARAWPTICWERATSFASCSAVRWRTCSLFPADARWHTRQS